MAKMLFPQKFIIETPTKTFNGLYRDLSKPEAKQLKEEFKDYYSSTKEINKLQSLITKEEKLKSIATREELFDVVIAREKAIIRLQDKVTKLDIYDHEEQAEALIKSRLEKTMSGDDKDAIFELCELHGYQTVHDTILEDIRDNAKKN